MGRVAAAAPGGVTSRGGLSGPLSLPDEESTAGNAPALSSGRFAARGVSAGRRSTTSSVWQHISPVGAAASAGPAPVPGRVTAADAPPGPSVCVSQLKDCRSARAAASGRCSGGVAAEFARGVVEASGGVSRDGGVMPPEDWLECDIRRSDPPRRGGPRGWAPVAASPLTPPGSPRATGSERVAQSGPGGDGGVSARPRDAPSDAFRLGGTAEPLGLGGNGSGGLRGGLPLSFSGRWCGTALSGGRVGIFRRSTVRSVAAPPVARDRAERDAARTSSCFSDHPSSPGGVALRAVSDRARASDVARLGCGGVGLEIVRRGGPEEFARLAPRFAALGAGAAAVTAQVAGSVGRMGSGLGPSASSDFFFARLPASSDFTRPLSVGRSPSGFAAVVRAEAGATGARAGGAASPDAVRLTAPLDAARLAVVPEAVRLAVDRAFRAESGPAAGAGAVAAARSLPGGASTVGSGEEVGLRSRRRAAGADVGEGAAARAPASGAAAAAVAVVVEPGEKTSEYARCMFCTRCSLAAFTRSRAWTGGVSGSRHIGGGGGGMSSLEGFSNRR